MTQKRKVLLHIIYDFKLRLNKIILWISIKLGFVRTILIVPYQGFGVKDKIFLVGRVIRDNHIGKSTPEDSVWKNIDKMFRRFNTVVIPGARLKMEILDEEFFSTTNEEGYFEFKIKLQQPSPALAHLQKVRLTLLDQVIHRQGEVTAMGEVTVPKGIVDYGIISDIDDTVIPTGAMRITEMLRTTFAKNAYSRVPFPGVSALYKALKKGKDDLESNPFFYVSSSPWNLYDFLVELLHVHQIPSGPLMLRDIGLSRTELISGSHKDHKLEQIRNILSFYPKLSFLLFGDSGQEDPTIYLQIVKEFPNRILAVIIRDVHESRREFANKIGVEMKQLGVNMLLVKDSLEATRYAISQGWILEDDLLDILRVKARDENESN